jgi:aryl-alcohol dehydrogenase-like predicted oxidoreductase
MPKQHGGVAAWVKAATLQSLQRLRVDSLYGLLLHRPQQLLDPEGPLLYAALQDLKRIGLVSKIGISIYEPAELDAIADRYPIDLVQSPFNVVDRRLRHAGWMQKLHRRGVELHARSAFLQGLLLMSPQSRPPKFKRWLPLLERWDGWLNGQGMTPLQGCVRHLLQFPEIDRVVVGVDSAQQLAQIAAAAAAGGVEVPDELHSNDPDLLNPSRWSAL